MRGRFVVFLSTLYYLTFSCISAFAAEERVYTVGIVPQQAATKLVREWTPLLNLLSEKTGYTLRFKTAVNISTFENRLFSGEYDFAYMNPYHYTVFSKRSSYRAFAKETNKFIQGILVVHKDSPIQSIDMLEKQTLALPSPAAFAASILPRAELREKGISISTRYVGSHEAVYHLVARKLYPAGGGILRTLNAVNPEIRGQLRILWTSAKHTPHAFAAHARVNPEVVSRIQKAMSELEKDPEGKKYLAVLHLKGFVAATDEDWQDIRNLNIDLLE